MKLNPERGREECGVRPEFDPFSKEKDWFNAVIDSSFDGLWICDREGRVVSINSASERINNIDRHEIIGKNLKELVFQGKFDKVVTFDVLASGRAVTIIQRTHTGKKMLITGNPIFNEHGEIDFVVINERDIQELDNLRTKLEQTKALAEAYCSKLSELEMKDAGLLNFVFCSREMQRIVDTAIKVAAADSTILLLGESGVGKGLLAKLIHIRSPRKKGPFFRVDCAAVPDTLIESELFGYERGAFTGAKREGKSGLLELASHGTLFLDEIGDIPMTSQAKLLRFLEDHEVIPIGGTQPKIVNARVIAATNKNLEEMVTLKKFREDLFYRLNIIQINIPPLRERREDILPLTMHYLEKFNQTCKKYKTLTTDAMDLICAYNFPGNIRELANLMERLVVMTEEERIQVSELPGTIANPGETNICSLKLPENISLKQALNECERFVIEKTLKKTGSQRRAAKILKVDHTTIARKAKRWQARSLG